MSAKCDVVIVGCGCPKRGMGWYHAKQLLDGEIRSGQLTDVVEPWFLGDGSNGPGGPEFNAWAETAKKSGVAIHKSVADLPDVPAGAKKMALVAGRAADNPRLLKELIAKGIRCIYLEKPGAPSVSELEGMAQCAKESATEVYMGYNKNVTKFVAVAREFEAKTPGAVTTFIHNNSYKPEELDECFARNCEGMLKNMAVHELCLLVSFYGVAVSTIAKVEVDKGYSKCEVRGGFTDFSKIGFTVTTNEGRIATVKADRCGGNTSEAIVSVDGVEKFKSFTPDAELEKVVAAKEAADPGYMPYFLVQHDDYVILKERVCARVVGGPIPEGVATLEGAIETLKVAEYLTPLLAEQLK